MVGIILIGQSNSGKSAIGKEVAKKLGIRYISSGDIARSMSDIQDTLNSGGMAPESMMRKAVFDTITSKSGSYILDGFPRFTSQYEWLLHTLNWWYNCRTSVITHKLIFVYVDVSKRDILSRAKLRGRDDDGSIKRKMKYFEENTLPMFRNIMEDKDNIVYTIKNGNNTDIQKNINKLSKIVEEHVCLR